MNRGPIKTLIFICVITAVGLVFAMPAQVPLNLTRFGIPVNEVLERPPLDLSQFGLAVYRDLEFKLGLDIQGGTRVVLEADMTAIAPERRDEALDSAKSVIARRVDLFGVSESVVKTSKVGEQYRVIAELPGVTDTQQALALLGSTAQLEFRELADLPPPQTEEEAIQQAEEYSVIHTVFGAFAATGLTGKDLSRSTVQFSQQTGEPVISLEFSEEGRRMFAEITTRNVGKPVGIFLDGVPLTLPNVNEPIPDGNAIISGGFTTDAAKTLSIQLNAGALPVPIQVVEQNTIGASLGRSDVIKTAWAGVAGVGLVMLFMILYYGWKGFLADVALLVYGVLTIAVYKLLPVTLTLPGIAGLLLSVGMAVDSNILIFERMKEELRLGKPFELAMRLGFGRAWDSIKDANVATLFTCFILFNPLEFEFLNRSGPVRGFALTLAVGIFVSLFTGIVVTRTLLRLFLHEGKSPKGAK